MGKEKSQRRSGGGAGSGTRRRKSAPAPTPAKVNLWLTAKDAIDDINCVSWSPAGSDVALAGKGRVVRLWDAASKRTWKIFEADSPVVRGTAWSPDGGALAACGDGGFVRAWDVAKGSVLISPDVPAQALYGVAFSPNGKLLASAGGDGTIRLWSLQTGQTFRVLRGHEDWVYCLAWAAGGSTLASGAADGIVNLWDVRGGRLLKTLKANHSSVYSLAWSPHDAPLLAAGSGDGATRVWDARTSEVLQTFNQRGAVRSVAWSPAKGAVVAAGSANGVVRTWSTETGAVLSHVADERFGLKSVSWSPDGRLLAFGGGEDVRLWDAERKWLLPREAKSDTRMSALSFSPDGGRFIVAVDSNVVELRDSGSDAVLRLLPTEPGTATTSFCWSADGSLLALGDGDGVVKLCSASTGEVLSMFRVSNLPVEKLALSAGGGTLAALAGYVLHTVNTETGVIRQTQKTQRSAKDVDLCVSRDGELLAFREEGQSVRLWGKRDDAVSALSYDNAYAAYKRRAYITVSDRLSVRLADVYVEGAQTYPSVIWDPSPAPIDRPDLYSDLGVPSDVQAMKEEDLLKFFSSDLADLWVFFRENQFSFHKLRETLDGMVESFVGSQARAPKQDKSGPWLKGKKKDRGHYVPTKEPPDLVTLLPPKLYPFDIGSYYFNVHSYTQFGSRRRASRYYSGADAYWPYEQASFARHSLWDSRLLDIEPGPLPPVIDVEGHYSRLGLGYGPAKSKGRGGKNRLRGLAWSPDGAVLAAGAGDGVIEVWDIKARRLSNRLEGHSGAILDLAWSEDGGLLASHSADGTVRVWRCDTWVHIKTLQAPDLNDIAYGVSFHRTATAPFTLAGGGAVVHDWPLDLAALLSASPDAASVHYTSAKIVLVGESNVGKSCLALRLAEGRYLEQGTTHGMRMWPIPPEKLDPEYDQASDGKRDVILWDMGGQDEYRLVHQLFLHDTTVALILLDPTRGRTAFNEVEGWNLRLEKQVGERRATKLLVGTKMDTKSTVIDRGGLERLISACKFEGFYATSAKADKGIDKLRRAMAAAINWDALVRTSRPALFQIIRDEIDRRRQKGEVVLLYTDLEERVRKLAPDQFDQKSIGLVVEQLALQGILAGTRLATGERVLVLQIGEIERYAGSIIIAARNNPRGVPALEEQTIASSKMVFPGINEEDRLHKFQERIVLECVVQLLLEHGICLKHEGLLIFPSLFEPTEREESIETHHSVSLYYDFSGAIDNIYSALIVRLAISEQFGRVRLWENRAEFDKAGEGVCGLRKVDHRSGLAHLDLFFSEQISSGIRDLFTVFVEEHLRREGVNITEVIEVTCECGYRFQESSLRKRLAHGQGDIICPECEVRNRISEGAQQVRSTNTEVEERLLALKTIIMEKSREAIISSKVAFMESAEQQSRALPVNILHLSDLHINADDDPMSLAQPLIQDIEDPKGGLGFDQLDYLVITGDLTNRATPEEFEKSHQFISTLIDRFKLTAERCVIAPGNHDLSWEKSVYEWRQRRLLDAGALKPGSYVVQQDVFLVRDEKAYPSRFENFSKFYHSLTQQEYPLRPEEQYIPFLFEDTLIQFLTMNSSWEIDEFFPERSGVNENALSRGLERADEQLRKARGEGRVAAEKFPLRIAVIHHPVLGGEQMSDDAFLERLRQADFNLCLHGHVHEERVGIVGPPDPVRNIHIVGAGSVGAPTYARPESVPRLYNVLQVAPARDNVRVHTRGRLKSGGAWRGWGIWPGDGPTDRRTFYDIKLPV